MISININELRVKGITKDYFVKFDKIPKINIIAGEIFTGKSSILDLIDYCFGASNNPNYPEIAKKGLTALLEFQIDNERMVIERKLFTTQNIIQIHFCDIENIENKHESIEVCSYQRTDEQSLSSFILSKINLWDIPLKTSPSKNSSDIQIMSFRDVLWFCYLKKIRVNGQNLLFEREYIKNIKLNQVFEILFRINSEKITLLSKKIFDLEKNINNSVHEIKILKEFVDSENIQTKEMLLKIIDELNCRINERKYKLKEIDDKIKSDSETSLEFRLNYLELQKNLQALKLKLRNDRKTLIRLIPLRGQYSEDIKKLNFLKKSKKILNPLRIINCPCCLSKIIEQDKDRCPLCGAEIINENEDIDISKEIRQIERKFKELNEYYDDLEALIDLNSKNENELETELKILRDKLDESMKNFISPYLTSREELIELIINDENEIKYLGKNIKIREKIEKDYSNIGVLNAKLQDLKKLLDKESMNFSEKNDIINSISEKFRDNLELVHFPKLSNAYIDNKLFPYIRNTKYSELRSEGAINLASICWIIAIFSEAMERNSFHPGFLMLDGIQGGIGTSAKESDFRDKSIVDGLYTLLEKTAKLNDKNELIVVDNHPPEEMLEKYKVAYYSGDPNKPPYGFIDDEVS